MQQPSGIAEPSRYPLPELTTITVTRPVDQLSPFEHLLIAEVLEQFRRIQRQDTTNQKGRS